MSSKPDETIAAAGAARADIRTNAITPLDPEKIAGLPPVDEGVLISCGLRIIIPLARTQEEYLHDKMIRNLNSWNCITPCEGEVGLSGEAAE